MGEDVLSVLEGEPIWVIRMAEDPELRPDLLSGEIRDRCAQAAEKLGEVGKGRVRRALERVLLLDEGRVQRALQLLCDCGVFEQVIPELHATVHFSQEAGRKHKDVWEHTKQVVAQAPPRPAVRWAALLHDIGKVQTRTFGPNGKVQFLGHAEKGAAMFRRISRRLGFPRELGRRVHFLILKHLRANQYTGQWSDSAVRRFYRQAGDYLEDLLDLSRADITTKRKKRKREARGFLDELTQRVAELEREDARLPPLPPGVGNAIMDHFDLKPGPLVGKMRKLLVEAVERGELAPRMEPGEYVDYLEAHRDLWEQGESIERLSDEVGPGNGRGEGGLRE